MKRARRSDTPATATRGSYELVEPRPQLGLALTAVFFLIWTAAIVLYPTPDTPTAASNLGVAIALLVLCVSPTLVTIAVNTAVGFRPNLWRTPWFGSPVIGAMSVLGIGAALVEVPRSAVLVAGAAMLMLLVGLIGAATKLRTAEAGLASAAIVEQRGQVAADVHDIVSHTLSVTLLHLSAARMALPDDPDDALESILDAERSGRQSMADLRSSIEVLRSGDPTRSRTLDTADLPALIEGVRATGTAVTVTGEPDADLPATVSTTLYRIVQEGLTNAMKHGTPPITISFDQTPNELAVTISNPLDGGRAHRPGPASGTAGARSRVEAIGGTFTSGPNPDGHTWRLSASIPTMTHPTTPGTDPHHPGAAR